MTKLILDVPEQDMGDALNGYFQNLRAISNMESGKQQSFRGGPKMFTVTKNATSVRFEPQKKGG